MDDRIAEILVEVKTLGEKNAVLFDDKKSDSEEYKANRKKYLELRAEYKGYSTEWQSVSDAYWDGFVA